MSTSWEEPTNRRRSWLAPVLAALTPGVGDIREGRNRGWVPFTLLVVAVTLAATISGRGRLALADSRDLRLLLGAAGALSVSMFLAAVQRIPGSGHRRGSGVAGGVVGAFLALLPVAAGAWVLIPQIELLDTAFVSAPTAVNQAGGSLIEIPGETTAFDPRAWEWTGATGSTPGDRFNVLLLGGDAGPGRWSLRTDSINLVSLDPVSGDTAMIAIPRNLTRAPMPGALAEKFPNGFDNIINAVYTWGAGHPDEVEAVLGPTEEPGASLISAVVGELTGVAVDAFVLVDMQGFIEVVDALGGVDVYLEKNIPAPGNVPGGKHPVGDMRKGWQTFDGTNALSYARSRKADSDYWRMGRQRCLLANLAAQHTGPELLANWPSLSRAIREHVTTNIDPTKIEQMITLARGLDSSARSVSLTPPLVQPSRWKPEQIRAIVQATINPAGATTTPEGSPTGNAVATADAGTTGSAASIDSSPDTTGTPAVATPLDEECRIRR